MSALRNGSGKGMGARALVVGAALALALAGGAGLAPRAAHAAGQPAAQGQSQWAAAGSAAEAAAAAGLARLGAPQLRVAGNDYANPAYASAGGVAQATYQASGTTLTLRKAAEGHAEGLVAADAGSLAARWGQGVDGIAVTLRGASDGKAATAEFTAGGASYGIALQGASMGADDVAAAVRAVRDANAEPQQQQQQAQPQQQAQQQQQQSQQQPKRSGTYSEDVVEDDMLYRLVRDAATGEILSKVPVGQCDASGNLLKDKGTYAETVEEDGVEYTLERDAKTGEIVSKTPQGPAAGNEGMLAPKSEGTYTETVVEDDMMYLLERDAKTGEILSKVPLARSDEGGNLLPSDSSADNA